MRVFRKKYFLLCRLTKKYREALLYFTKVFQQSASSFIIGSPPFRAGALPPLVRAVYLFMKR